MRRALTIAMALLGSAPLALGAQGTDPHAGHAPAHHATTADAEALSRQIAAVRRATAKYQDVRKAQRDGFVRFIGGEAPLVGEHWFRRDLVNAPLDLERPSTLQYATIGGERRLIGVAYTVYQRPGEAPPEGFAGPDDHWHVHDIPELAKLLTEDRPLLKWLVGRRIDRGRVGPGEGRTQLVMVHAWLWLDNPDGMFALHHRAVPYLQAGLPAAWAALSHEGEDAARGLSLIGVGSCPRELRRLDRLVRLSFRQEAELREACDAATRRVADAREAVRDTSAAEAMRFDHEAAAAWRAFIAARDAVLTDAQRERLAQVMATTHEH